MAWQPLGLRNMQWSTLIRPRPAGRRLQRARVYEETQRQPKAILIELGMPTLRARRRAGEAPSAAFCKFMNCQPNNIVLESVRKNPHLK